MNDLSSDFERLDDEISGTAALCEVMAECLMSTPSESGAHGIAMEYIARLMREQKEAFLALQRRHMEEK